jgi:CRISPR system Cascade subunit CasE
MSWLVQITVDFRLADERGLIDSYAWHQALWDCFPNEPDKKRDFLTRIDEHQGYFSAWLLAQSEPVLPSWCSEHMYRIRKIAPTFLTHRFYAFDLRANPIHAQVQRDENGRPLLKSNGKRKSSKRVPITDEYELRSWLERKASTGGFRIDDSHPVEIGCVTENYFSQKGNKAWHGGVQFRGTLEVTDQKLFEETYYSGIGGAKGFGFGLLLLAPVSHQ